MQKCCLQFIVANSIFVDKIPKMHCGLKEPWRGTLIWPEINIVKVEPVLLSEKVIIYLTARSVIHCLIDKFQGKKLQANNDGELPF